MCAVCPSVSLSSKSSQLSRHPGLGLRIPHLGLSPPCRLPYQLGREVLDYHSHQARRTVASTLGLSTSSEGQRRCASSERCLDTTTSTKDGTRGQMIPDRVHSPMRTTRPKAASNWAKQEQSVCKDRSTSCEGLPPRDDVSRRSNSAVLTARLIHRPKQNYSENTHSAEPRTRADRSCTEEEAKQSEMEDLSCNMLESLTMHKQVVGERRHLYTPWQPMAKGRQVGQSYGGKIGRIQQQMKAKRRYCSAEQL
ncbi:unnamed protein product [Protopolystoma xenopodis]|uniref:Uncharacterized protein n=2 Tax=Protopolystoma xenopodis TaxID=117903 RepID=A0A3S5B616_9PLAT|nr:unnamed protein product [Protopolystoma xenopodis]